MRLWNIEEFWTWVGCAALVFCIESFFVLMVYGFTFGDSVKQMDRLGATGEGDIEKG